MASPTENVEREIKLSAALDFHMPDLRGLAGGIQRLPVQELRATYIDTPDFRLWDWDITLRYRTGEGGHGIWTLKLPLDVDSAGLRRTELSWPGALDAIPPEATARLRGIVRHASLGPIVALATTRRRLALRDASGEQWAELDDDLVTVSGGPQDGLRFRQLEIEFETDEVGIAGPPAFVAVIDGLRLAGARPGDGPKLAKALEPWRAAGARGQLDALEPESSLAHVVRTSINDGLTRMLEHDLGFRRDFSDLSAHDIHQARVATRRLRSDLKTFHRLLDPIWLSHTRTELKWLGDLLGHVRDLDVLTATLGASEAVVAADGVNHLHLLIGDQRRRASQDVARVLRDDERYLHLLERLHTAWQSPPFLADPDSKGTPDLDPAAPAKNLLPSLVHRQWRTLRKTVRHAGAHPSDQELHRIRIASKQLRYAAELSTPVIGKGAHRTAKAGKRLQTLLGDHHDAVSAERWLRTEGLRADPEVSFAAGQLAATLHRHQQSLGGRWRGLWDPLKAKKRHRWLH